MSMFDSLTCEYPLPLPEDLGECLDVDWSEIDFQTKSFGEGWGGVLDNYSIEEDGQLYLNKVNRAFNEDGSMEETPDGVERKDYTGELVFYTLILKESSDYWIEFKAIYYKGDLKEIVLVEWKKEENSHRKSEQDKFDNLIENWKKREKKWWFKFYKIYLFFVQSIFSIVRWMGQAIIKVAFWIEKRIT